jgi:hypothetical protein
MRPPLSRLRYDSLRGGRLHLPIARVNRAVVGSDAVHSRAVPFAAPIIQERNASAAVLSLRSSLTSKYSPAQYSGLAIGQTRRPAATSRAMSGSDAMATPRPSTAACSCR